MELRKLKTYKIQLISINLDKYNKINNLALLTKNFVGRILNNMKAPPIFSLCSLRNFFYLSIVNKQVLTEDAYIYISISTCMHLTFTPSPLIKNYCFLSLLKNLLAFCTSSLETQSRIGYSKNIAFI